MPRLAPVTMAILLSIGYISYLDGHKTYLTIISENPISEVKVASRNNKSNNFVLNPKSISDSKNYAFNKRIPFDDYNITINFTSKPSQFFTRTFRKRIETLVIF